MPARTLHFEAVDARTATLTVVGAGGSFRCASEGTPRSHTIGEADGPLFVLTQSLDPDAGWTLETRTAPTTRGVNASDGSTRAIEALYRAWARDSAAAESASALSELPPGTYRLVRFAPPAPPMATLLLGNEYVPAPVGRFALFDERPLHAAVIGRDANVAPDLQRPLFAVVFLGYVGDDVMDGVLAFEGAVADSVRAFDGVFREREGVLVVPMDGDLVVDALSGGGSLSSDAANDSRARKEAWRDVRGPAAAKRIGRLGRAEP